MPTTTWRRAVRKYVASLVTAYHRERTATTALGSPSSDAVSRQPYRGVSLMRETVSVLSQAIVEIRLAWYWYLRKSIHSQRTSSFAESMACICIGNATWGGSGKTPCALYLIQTARRLKQSKQIALLVTRGYSHDEVHAAENHLGGPQYLCVGGDRMRAIEKTMDQYHVSKGKEQRQLPSLVVMDDGFQHLGMTRDINILMIDALKPRGENGLLIPLGSLREPLWLAMSRADLIVIHNSDLVPTRKLKVIRRYLASIYRNRVRFSVLNRLYSGYISEVASETSLRKARTTKGRIMPFITHSMMSIVEFLEVDYKTSQLQQRGWNDVFIAFHQLKSIHVTLFCGIGNPKAFSTVVQRHFENYCPGIKVHVQEVEFPDHHEFELDELKAIFQESVKLSSNILITTEKDWFRDPRIIWEAWSLLFSSHTGEQPFRKPKLWIANAALKPENPEIFEKLLNGLLQNHA